MSIILKSRQVKFRNTGSEDYHGVNVISEEKTTDMLEQIQQKGQQVIESIPDDYTELANEVTNVKNDLSELPDDVAPAIVVQSIEAFSHDNLSSVKSIVFHGNSLAFGTASYINSLNYAPEYNISEGTVNDIAYTSNGHFFTLNGTGSGTSRFVVKKLEKAPAFPLNAGTYKFILAMSHTVAKSMRIFIQAQYTDGTSATLADKYVTNGFTETVTISKSVRIIRIDIGSYGENVHTNQVLWFGLYNASAIVVDTEQTVASSGTYQLNLSDGSDITALDTMQHTSVITYVADTKSYVDSLDVDINEKLTYITPEKFGAVGDGSTDDTVALQACINSAITRTGSLPIAIRGYGHYKITSPLTIHGFFPDVVINKITYTGNDAAVIIHSFNGKMIFGEIVASTGTNAVGIRCSATNNPEKQCDGFSDNYLECSFIYANGNAIECIFPSTAQSEGIYYNVFRLPRLWSNNANLIYVDAPDSYAENDFYGKYVNAQNGYLYYRENAHNNSTHVSTRLHQFSIEHNVKNGIYGNVALIECRTREMMDRRRVNDDTAGGFLFDFTGVVPNATKDDIAGDVDLTSIKYSTALTFADTIEMVKDAYASGVTHEYTLSSIIGSNGHSYAHLKNCVRASIGGYYTLPGDVYIYYNHMAYKPLEDWYYIVDGDMTITFTPGNLYITPTIFDMDTTATIRLDDSYCCLAINNFQLIQHDGKTAVVYDKLGNKIFDGANLGEGTYRFTCSRVPLKTLNVEMRNGDVYTFAEQSLVRVYTGSNEEWTVSGGGLISRNVLFH